VDTGNDLLCPACLTRPNRFYIHLGYNGVNLRLYGLGKSKPFRSYFHAKRVLEKLGTEIDEKKFDPSHYVKKKFESYNVERFITDRWLKSKRKTVEKKQFSQASFKRVAGIINRLILPYFRDKDIRDIKTGQIQEFFEFLPSRYSAKSLKNIMGLLHKILIDAKRWGYIIEVPGFPAITVPQAPPKWIHEDLQEAVLKRIKEKYPQHYNIILFMRYQGTRPGETRALMWDCVDFKDEQILILRAYDGSTLKEFPKKKLLSLYRCTRK
jgi:integrase